MIDNNEKQYFDKGDSYSLRGICMILIIIHHLYQYSIFKYGFYVSPPFSTILQSLGYLSTSVFFLLSGYGLFISLKMKKSFFLVDMFTYMSKLLSPFLYIWLLDLFVYLIKFDCDFVNVLYSFITLKYSSSGNLLWFFKEIITLYIVTYLVFKWVKQDNSRIYIILLLTLTFISLSVLCNLSSMWWNTILCFPIGMICAKRNENQKPLLNPYLLMGILMLFIASFFFTKVGKGIDNVYIVSIIVSSITFSISIIGLIRYLNLQNKLFDYIGKNSLIFYLSHIFLLTTLLSITSFAVFTTLVIVGSFIISLMYSIIKSKYL